MSWYGAGAAYHALGRAEEATHFHRRAAATHHDLGDSWHEALALEALASALEASGPHKSQALRLIASYDDSRATAMRRRLAE
ncbi:hypothetical protein [Streptomyces niveus]|uniref:hypothetical protein n=1 Tax=Streptomyces niveus TaxID=193462 RepID=UPI00378E5B5F|nr:hypothetical protein OG211_13575 [Streptomyces niveus]